MAVETNLAIGDRITMNGRPGKVLRKLQWGDDLWRVWLEGRENPEHIHVSKLKKQREEVWR